MIPETIEETTDGGLPCTPCSASSEPLHVYDWLELPPANDAEKDAKEWLDKFTRPAWTKMTEGIEDWLARYRVTVEWKGNRYTCSGASRMGDVWLKTEGSSDFYDHRVNVEELSNWKRILLPNVKEHAPLSAGASVDHWGDVESTQEHENRAADRGCCVSTCSVSSFSVGGGDIPKSYKQAIWRNVLPVSRDGMMGIGLNVDGVAARYKITVDDARKLADSISDYIRSHSDKSAGIPSSSVSTPPMEGEKV